MDQELRGRERAWRETPTDPTAVGAYVEALERAGQPVPLDLLDARVHEPRRFESRSRLRVTATSPDGDEVRVGWTGASSGGLAVPAHRSWRVEARPRGLEELHTLVEELAAQRVIGLSLDCSLLPPRALCVLETLGPRLEELQLSWRRRGGDTTSEGVTDGLTSVATALPGLRRLKVSGPLTSAGLLTDAGLRALGALDRLETLDVETPCDVTESGLATLSPSLRDLRIGFRRDTPLGPLRRLPWLEALELRSAFRHDGALVIASIPGLRRLQVRGWGVDEADVDALIHRPLSRLALDVQPLSDSTLRKLAERDLEVSLKLPHATTERVGLAAGLERLTSIVLLNLSASVDLTPLQGRAIRALRFLWGDVSVGHVRVLSTLPRLRSVSWSGAVACAPGAIETLAELRPLERLALWNIDQDALRRLPTLPALTSLDVRVSGTICDHGLSRIARCEALEELSMDLDGAGFVQRADGVAGANIVEGGLEHLASLPRLHTLSLSPKLLVDRPGVESLAHVQSLEELSLPVSRGALRSTSDLHELAALPALRRLTVHQLSPTALPSLEARLPQVEIVPD